MDVAAFYLDDGTVPTRPREARAHHGQAPCFGTSACGPTGWKVRHVKCFALLGVVFFPLDCCLPEPCRETHDPTRPPPVSNHRPRPPSHCSGWCQISYHARTMSPNSLLLCALKMQTSLKNCGDFANTQGARLLAHFSVKKGGRATLTWPQLGLRSAATCTTTQLGAQTARHAPRATYPTCATHTRWKP